MNEERPTKKEKRGDQEIVLILCARCCQWTPRGAGTCEHCKGAIDWDKR
jgi:hypothetical protein